MEWSAHSSTHRHSLATIRNMSRSRACNCASCAVCTCPGPARHCDREAEARRNGGGSARSRPQQSHYKPEDLMSVTAASYRPPSAADLAAGRARAPKPEWSVNTREPLQPRPFDAQTTAQVSEALWPASQPLLPALTRPDGKAGHSRAARSECNSMQACSHRSAAPSSAHNVAFESSLNLSHSVAV